MYHWYSLSGTAIYINDKTLQGNCQRQVWMVLCCCENKKMLLCYDNEEKAFANEHSFLSMELHLCDLGFADFSKHFFTLKWKDCTHTFQMKSANQAECWYSRLSTMVANSHIYHKDIQAVSSRERTTSGGMVQAKSKLLLQRQFISGRSHISLDKDVKETISRSPVSDCLYSNRTSISIDLSDDVFNSNMSRSLFKDSGDKSFHTFTEGVFKDNDIMYLFDTIRDKTNQQMNDMKLELLLTQIDFLEHVLYHLISGDINDIQSRYGRKIKSILDAEREENPTLPTICRLPNISNYVDNYGFKHNFEEGGSFKLICQKLMDDLKLKSQSLNYQVRRISESINSPCSDVYGILEIFNNGAFVGFPTILRKSMWNLLATHHLKKIEFPILQTNNYFVMLLQQINNVDGDIRRTIKVESYKMYNQNIYFDRIDASKIKNVQNIMVAIYARNPGYKYSSLLMKIAAMSILILEQSEVFRLLVAISDSLIGPKVINQSSSIAECDQLFLNELIASQDRALHDHLRDTNTDISFITKKWIENIFIDSLPFESSLRIFDIFLIKGKEWIILISLVIVKIESKKLMNLTKPYDIFKHLNTRYCNLYDIDYILEETKHLEATLSDSYIRKRRKELCNQYIKGINDDSNAGIRTNPIRFQDNSAAFRHIPGKIECTSFNNEHIFIAVARQSNSVIYVLNILCGFVQEETIQVSSFVSVMICAKSLLLISSDIGTISSYRIKERLWLWEITLQNCPLDMAFVDNDATNQLFVGLDNGSLAIIENVTSKSASSTFHLQVSPSPIYKMVYSSPFLICVSRESILIIDTCSTAVINKITPQLDSQMIIQDMKLDNTYLWLIFKGSTIIQLWNIETCSIIFSQNIALFQGRRVIGGTITILHPIIGQNQLWVATDTGEMFIFDVKCTMSRELPVHNSDLQLTNNSWECHQSVVDKVVDYLSSMSNDSPRRLSVAIVDNDFVDISVLPREAQPVLDKTITGESYDNDNEHNSFFPNDEVFNSGQNSMSMSNSKEEIYLRQKIFLSLKGGMKISDSPIQHICSLIDIGEAFITLSSYMEEENNMVIWKQEAQGWKYKVMHYHSLKKSESFFSRLLQRINSPLK